MTCPIWYPGGMLAQETPQDSAHCLSRRRLGVEEIRARLMARNAHRQITC